MENFHTKIADSHFLTMNQQEFGSLIGLWTISVFSEPIPTQVNSLTKIYYFPQGIITGME
jgi:hypothetical protein